MRRKYRIKKKAENEFSALAGVDAIQLFGALDCLVIKPVVKMCGVPVLKFAYQKYYGIEALNRNIVFTTKCGVTNCVKKSHLKAVYNPSKADKDYIDTYLKIDGEEVIAKNLNVPIHLFHSFINSIDK